MAGDDGREGAGAWPEVAEEIEKSRTASPQVSLIVDAIVHSPVRRSRSDFMVTPREISSTLFQIVEQQTVQLGGLVEHDPVSGTGNFFVAPGP